VVELGTGERTAVPHLHFLGALGRRIDRVPALRDRLWRLEAATLERVWRALGAGDPDTVSARGERLGRLIGPRLRKQRHVLFNLATAFPDWPAVRVEAVATRVWGAVGRTMLEHACLGQIGDPAAGRVRVVDLGGLEHVRRTGRPGIFVASHLANWNMLPMAAAHVGLPLTVVYRRQSNPRIEALMTEWRAALGCDFLEVAEASRGMLRELRRGRSVGLLVDQRYDRGVAVPFFGRPAPTTLVPARLALRLGVPLIPARIERRGGARFVITVHRPIEPMSELGLEEAAVGMTIRVNQLFERWIAAAPDQWYCAKRRWPRPHSRKAKHTRFLAGRGAANISRANARAATGEQPARLEKAMLGRGLPHEDRGRTAAMLPPS
jgi:KDO2-lipid IV(A) lauroyltransferase